MATSPTPAANPKFCSDCGAKLNPGARFCHECGAPVPGRGGPAASTAGGSSTLRWAVPGIAIVALLALTVFQFGARNRGGAAEPGAQMPLGGTGVVPAPDISSMSPEERADRLFNRVMRLSSEGKADSAAFFGPMARGALEALTPLNAHRRYDLGLVLLVTGDAPAAAAQADTILRERATHLLGLVLAARAADARGDAAAAKDFRGKLLAVESAERASRLPEYIDHEADLRAAVDSARRR